jgi:hypothetical protein
MTVQKTALPKELRRIRLVLAREPGHPEGDADFGYDLVAPLTAEGRIDAEEWRDHKHLCRVVRFRPDEPDEVGHLARRPGGGWVFRYDVFGHDSDEAGFHFNDHVWKPGEYVSITEDEGMHTFRIVSVGPA